MGKLKQIWHGLVAVEVLVSLGLLIPFGAVGQYLRGVLLMDTFTTVWLMFTAYALLLSAGFGYYRKKREKHIEERFKRAAVFVLQRALESDEQLREYVAEQNHKTVKILERMMEMLAETASKAEVELLREQIKGKADKPNPDPYDPVRDLLDRLSRNLPT